MTYRRNSHAAVPNKTPAKLQKIFQKIQFLLVESAN